MKMWGRTNEGGSDSHPEAVTYKNVTPEAMTYNCVTPEAMTY
jgi:hypothetical protein